MRGQSLIHHFAFFTLSLLIAVAAQAGLGPELPKYESPASVCMIRFPNDRGPDELCSGTLISPREVQTAAHCVYTEDDSIPDLIVQCGDQTTRALHQRLHSNFNFQKLPFYPELRRFDLAVLTLQDRMTQAPVALAQSEQEIKEILRTAHRCGIFGYGGVGPKDPQYGQLKGTEVFPETLEWVDGHLEINSSARRISGRVEPGDSGGSFACRVGNQWTHLATISGRKYYQSLLAPVHFDIPLVQPQFTLRREEQLHTGLNLQLQQALSRQEHVDHCLSELAQARKTEPGPLSSFESLKEKSTSLEQELNKLQGRLFAARKGDSGADVYNSVKPDLKTLEKELALAQASCQDLQTKYLRGQIGHTFYVKPYSPIDLDLEYPDTIQVPYEPEQKRILAGTNPWSTVDHQYARFEIEEIDGDVAIGVLVLLGYSENHGCEGGALCREGRYENARIGLDRLRLKKVSKQSR